MILIPNKHVLDTAVAGSVERITNDLRAIKEVYLRNTFNTAMLESVCLAVIEVAQKECLTELSVELQAEYKKAVKQEGKS